MRPALTREGQAESATSNRKDLIAETTAARSSAKTVAKLERKRKQLESMGEKAEAAETGEDLERKKNWEYSIEGEWRVDWARWRDSWLIVGMTDNEKWDKKKARKTSRADFSYTGALWMLRSRDAGADGFTWADLDDLARRKYKKVCLPHPLNTAVYWRDILL
jgi:pre-mRNA-splicing factor SYF2